MKTAKVRWVSTPIILASVLILTASIAETTGQSAPHRDWYKTSFSALVETGGDVTIDSSGSVTWAVGTYNSSTTARNLNVRRFSATGAPVFDVSVPGLAGTVVRMANNPKDNSVGIVSAYVGAVTGGVGNTWYGNLGLLDESGTLSYGGKGNITVIEWDGRVDLAFNCGVAVDGSGNMVYVFPYNIFNGPYQSDPDLAIVKYSPSGSLIWVKKVVGPGQNIPAGVAIDSQSNIYVAGFNQANAGFDATIVNSYGGWDGFLAKYDQNGVLQWVQRPNSQSDDTVTGITIGLDGNIWVTGTFVNSITAGGVTLSASPFANYIARFSPVDGGVVSLAKFATEVGIRKILAAHNQGIIVSGDFVGSLLFGQTVTNHGNLDVFAAHISSTGLADWTYPFGYINNDSFGGVAAGPSGEVVVSGTVSSGVVIDGDFIQGTSNADALLVHLSPSTALSPQFTTQPQSTIVSGGMDIQLTASATGDLPITYQWWFNGGPLTGQTSASLVVTNAKPENAGSYFVVAHNGAGDTPSEVANVSYTDAGSLQLSVHPSLTIFGTLGRTYRIDYAVETRSPAVWTTVTNISLPFTPYVWQDTNAAISDKRFYRVLLQP